ncbi:MAG: hypothetical protein ACUVSX_07365 [Aggregatilineales bacterium]
MRLGLQLEPSLNKAALVYVEVHSVLQADCAQRERRQREDGQRPQIGAGQPSLDALSSAQPPGQQASSSHQQAHLDGVRRAVQEDQPQRFSVDLRQRQQAERACRSRQSM